MKLSLDLSLAAFGGWGRASSEIPFETLPDTAEGMFESNGPLLVVGKGPSSHIMAHGAVKDDGSQVVRLINRYTGESIEAEHNLHTGDPDDHCAPAIVAYADGSFSAASSEHNTETTTYLSRRAPDGTWTDSTLTWSGGTTYNYLILDKNEKLWFFTRTGDTAWEYRTRNTFSGAWSSAILFLQDSVQTYATPKYNYAEHKIYLNLTPNSASGDYGTMKTAVLDCASAVFTDGSGTLVIPFDPDAVDVVSTPPANYRYSILDRSYDPVTGNEKLLMCHRHTSDTADNPVYLWTRESGDSPFDEGNYTKTGPVYNTGGLMEDGGNAGGRFDTAPHSGTRIFAVRKIAVSDAILGSGTLNMWTIEQMDNVSGDGTTWTTTRLTAGRKHSVVPTPAVDADETTPIMYSRRTSFTDYETYSGARVAWCAPWLGRAGFKWLTETETYFTRVGATPSALFKNQLNSLIYDVKDDGLLTENEALWLMVTETEAQRLQSLTSDDVLTGAAKPTFVARTAVTYSAGLFYSTGLVAGAGKLAQDTNYGVLGNSGTGTGQADFGTGNWNMVINDSTDSGKIRFRNHAAAASTATNVNNSGRGFMGMARRASATNTTRFNSSTTGSNVAQNSVAPDGFVITVGARSTNAGGTTVGSTCARTHWWYAFGGSLTDANASALRGAMASHASLMATETT